MAIYRTKSKNNFTILDNGIFVAGGLAWDSRGLLCTLLSKSEDWNVIVKALEKETEGTRKHTKERGIWDMLNELIDAGYVIRKKRQSGEVDYFVYDIPQTAKTAACENGSLPKPQTAKTADCVNVGVLINTDSTQRKEKRKKELICADVETSDEQAVIVVEPEQTKSKPANQVDDETRELRRQTWEAYKHAYKTAYGVEPERNAVVNRNIVDFVSRVGQIAPHVAAFYVHHPNHWYRQKGHDLGTLVSNWQAVTTDWKRNTRTTSVQAKQAEKTAANMASHGGAIDILKAKGLM